MRWQPAAAAVAETRSGTDLRVALLGALALLLWDACGLDLPLMRLIGSGAGFALREHWLASGVLHRGGYWLSVLLFAGVLRNCLGPWHDRSLDRATRIAWLGGLVLSLLLVPALKQASATSCPWSLAEFGGSAHYLAHWAWGVVDGGPGRCFPGGHASGAFAFVAGGFALREHRPARARAWLLGSLLLGMVFSLAQTLRGAHYPSHGLYSAWICWCVCATASAVARRSALGLAARVPRPRAADSPAKGGAGL